jgi:Zn finger protein HypA/HybF involved in hydrogenase expression
VNKLISFEEHIPHKVSETICIKCGHRQIDVRPEGTLLKDLECPQCRETGFIIETGEDVSDEGGEVE